MALECSLHMGPDEAPPPTDVPLTVHVDLIWSGEGEAERFTLAGRYSTCVAQLQVRHAVVSGQVQTTASAASSTPCCATF
jgi:hypothetical protein